MKKSSCKHADTGVFLKSILWSQPCERNPLRRTCLFTQCKRAKRFWLHNPAAIRQRLKHTAMWWEQDMIQHPSFEGSVRCARRRRGFPAPHFLLVLRLFLSLSLSLSLPCATDLFTRTASVAQRVASVPTESASLFSQSALHSSSPSQRAKST